MKTLTDWQEADVTEALKHDSWFLAYEMGLGKTVCAVEWAKRKGGVNTIIVVAPLNTFTSWEKTIKEQIPDANVYQLKNERKHVENFARLNRDEPGWYLIGWELMRGGAITGEWADLAIADETHKQANFGRSLQSLFVREIRSKYKLALSGTPAANRPEGIFATLNWLWPKQYSSYWNWVDKYWRSIRNGAVITLVREVTPGAIIRDIPMFSRRLVRDHRQDMPAILPEIPIAVEMSVSQRKIYDRLAAEAGVWLEDDFISTSVGLTENLRLRQICLAVPTVIEGEVTFKENAASTKIDALIEVLLTDEFKEQTFLVLTHSARIVPTVVAKLAKKGIIAEGFTGDSKADLAGFGTKYRVLVAGIAAIGEGTDGLQNVCHNMFWLSKHPSWLLNEQAGQRLDRMGQTQPVNQWYTYVPGTVDEESLQRLGQIEESLVEVIDRKPYV